MNYFIKRGDQEYGPYTLAALQQYVAQGNVSPQDMARSEGMTDWMPVSNILGNVPVPMTTTSSAAAVNVPPDLPPGLHWGWVLVLSICTFGIFAVIWLFVEAAWLRRVVPESQGLYCLAGYLGAIVVAVALNGSPVAGIVNLAGLVLYLVGVFKMRSDIEDYSAMLTPPGISLSGGMTFFFNVIYFQYHLRELRETAQHVRASAAAGAAVGSY